MQILNSRSKQNCGLNGTYQRELTIFFLPFFWNVQKESAHSFNDCPKAGSLISEIVSINNLSQAYNLESRNKSYYFGWGGVMTFSWLIRNFRSKCYRFRPDIAKTIFPKGMQFDDKQLYFQPLIDRFRIAFIKFNKVPFEVCQLPLCPLLCGVANYRVPFFFQKEILFEISIGIILDEL